jgi:hypothetical protein
MRGQLLAVAVLTLLLGTLAVQAQVGSPLQFKLIDVNQAIRKFDNTAVMVKPRTPALFNLPSFYPKISLAPFPPRAATPQLPGGFNLPVTNTPIAGTFPFIPKK